LEQQRPHGEKQHPFTGQAAPTCGGRELGGKRGPVAGGRRTVKVEILKNTTEA